MKRGTLRVYLGAAPGVGKTFAMLNEGWRRRERGTDVVVGFMETHGRPSTAAQVRDLEVVPRRLVRHRDAMFEEMDLDAILARKPSVALIDELPHTNQPGSRHAKRWEDVGAVLDAGIDVVTCINIQHIESLNDVVEQITGIRQPETVPDTFLRSADQVELVDMAPEALRRRMAHGNIYRAERVDAALAHYFKVTNLAALRELALLWVADRVEDGLADHRRQHQATTTWETRERVMVALTGAPDGDRLVRRASRIAGRTHADLIGVHVRPTDGLAGAADDPDRLRRAVELLGSLGGRYLEVSASSVPDALAEVARAQGATQLVIGASARSRWAELVSGSIVNDLLRRANSVDVHVIRHDEASAPTRRRPAGSQGRWLAPLPPGRRRAGWVLALAAMPAAGLAMTTVRGQVGVSGSLLIMLGLVVAASAAGGLIPGLTGAVIGFATVDWYFVPPVHHWRIDRISDVVALLMFVVIAAGVSVLVDRLARRSAEAHRATEEAEALAGLARRLPVEADSIDSIVDEVRGALERADERSAADDLRTAILAAVSHDLRTPIASIKAVATSLLADDIEWDGAAVRGFSEGIDRDADRLAALITNLLDMSRLQAGVVHLDLEPVAVIDAVRQAVRSINRPAPPPGLEIDDDLTALADAPLLQQVLVNVVDNAILHGGAGTPVQVQASRTGSGVTIRVVDRGPGIPPDRHDDVLQPFQRLGDTEASSTGLGLGLALSRGFMKAMGGELTVEDTPGGGVSVVLELEAAESTRRTSRGVGGEPERECGLVREGQGGS